MSSTIVHADSNSDLKTVYHVYVGDQHIGAVDDKGVVETILDDKLRAAEKQAEEDITLILSEPVTYVEEKTFDPHYVNETVADFIKTDVTVEAEAVGVKVGDEIVGYFKDEETARQLIHNYQIQYVDESVLDDIKALKKAEQKDSDDVSIHRPTVPKFNKIEVEDISLNLGDTIITDVILSKDVSYESKNVHPKELLTLKQGLKKLNKGTLEDQVHTVQEGDVLGSIAGQYDLTTKGLLELNEDLNEDSVLQIGQELNVTAYAPLMTVIVNEEELVEKDIAHETEYVQSDELFKGETEVKQNGKDGKKEIHYDIEKQNGQVVNKTIVKETVIEESVKEIIVEGTKVIPSRGSGELSWPTVGGYISSYMGMRWGRMHKGIDIARPSNRTIKAADNGVVTSAGYQGGFGNKIVIDHNNGMKTIYAHMSSLKVRVGQVVQKGQSIGVMGSTGQSTGVHLHFEVYKNGVLQNPMKYLR
nr:M23 family metallopeptidase [Lentibacillus saliphilus]